MFMRRLGNNLEPSFKVVTNARGQERPSFGAAPPEFERVAPNSAKFDGVVVIGGGTRIIGEISDCHMVEIQGVLEGKVVADSVVIRDGGGFQGTMQAGTAEIYGVVEGAIAVTGDLNVHSTGDVSAETTYGKLSVAAGGKIQGRFRAGANPAAAAAPNAFVNGKAMNGTDVERRNTESNSRQRVFRQALRPSALSS